MDAAEFAIAGAAMAAGVPIEHQEYRKPFLGGFRHKVTAAEFHHASSQTEGGPRREMAARAERFHRDSQTVVSITRSAQTGREQGTQMARKDLVVDARGDREVIARPYFLAVQLDELKLRKAIVIQCYYRGYRARKRVREMHGDITAQREALRLAEEERVAEEAKRQEREIQRRMHPRSTDDFEVLYNELEAWRFQETKRINSASMGNEERLAALAQLLHKETKLLQTIDRLRSTATKENRRERINAMLRTMAEPKQWACSDGEVSKVHTPFTVRAKELMELYNGLTLPLLSVEERLDVLLHVKWTVKEFDCVLTRDIVELIDREADLLNRGRSEKTLSALRKRLANLFLQFIETPDFNPEAARFQRAPRELMLRPNIVPIQAGARVPRVAAEPGRLVPATSTDADGFMDAGAGVGAGMGGEGKFDE